MNRIIVLGAGRVGAAMALDLAGDPRLDVAAADASQDALGRLKSAAHDRGVTVRTLPVDLSDPGSLTRILDGRELAIGAVPGPMGFDTLRRVLRHGLHVVDISFFDEDPAELDDIARRRGRVAIIDAGVAPGLSNLILGHHEARSEAVDRFDCLVGGIPAEPKEPWNYKAPFSPIDVIAEYTRPARIRRAGAEVTLPALAEIEEVEVDGVGRLEAFLTDGLRTLLRTSRTPDLVEKTLRWPGHASRVAVLRDTGLFDPEPREVDDARVAPLDLTARLLFDAWRYEPGEADLMIMEATVSGTGRDGPFRHRYRLLDRYDAATDTSAMARCTGYTATAIARLVIDGEFREPGLTPPETLASQGPVLEYVLGYLAERGVRVTIGPGTTLQF